MKLSNKGLNLIKQFEGLVLKPYKAVPTETYLTIGYGHYGSDVKEDVKITKEQAEQMLIKDTEKFEGIVNSLVTVSLNQNQFDALVSFVYNVGSDNFKKSTLLKKLNSKDYVEAGNEFSRWNKSGGKVYAGLVKRRVSEMQLFMKPIQSEKVITKNYRVLYGENLTVIAKRFKTTVDEIMKLNPQIKDKNIIYTNQLIKIPK